MKASIVKKEKRNSIIYLCDKRSPIASNCEEIWREYIQDL